jgi:hypothetical protein
MAMGGSREKMAREGGGMGKTKEKAVQLGETTRQWLASRPERVRRPNPFYFLDLAPGISPLPPAPWNLSRFEARPPGKKCGLRNVDRRLPSGIFPAIFHRRIDASMLCRLD